MSKETKTFAQAFLNAQKQLGAVKKGTTNPFYTSKYADINDVIKTIKDILNDNGIAFLQPTKVIEVSGQKVNVVKTVLLHESGECFEGEIEIKCAKEDAQKFGAAITYSRRFGLQSIVGLPAEDDDGNTASGKSKKYEAKELPPKKENEVKSTATSSWT